MQEVQVGLGIVAIVEAIKDTLKPKYNLTGNQTRVFAIAIGAAVGYFHLFSLNLESGAMAGLVAVGGHTLVSAMGKEKKEPLP